MLEIENLSIEADGKKIINGIDLEVKEDEIIVIMGPNGTGKSTICKTIMGDENYKITDGTIKFNGKKINNLDTSEIAKMGIFLLFQNPVEIPGVTNAEMLRTVLVDRGIKESIFDFNKRVNQSCEKLGIDKSFIHRNINEYMSGGEKKKNELLQIDILKPQILILDELDSGLDIDSLKELSNGLNEYKKETKASILIITHHTNILKYLHPDRVYVLLDGKIEATGDISLAESIEKNGFKGAFSVSDE